MASQFSTQDIIEATHARCVQPGIETSFSAVCTDSRNVSQGSLFVALVGELFNGHQFVSQAFAGGSRGVIVQRGQTHGVWPSGLTVFEVENTLSALGALGRFHRDRFSIPLCAITGSNGKTTSKEMVASILATRGPILKTLGNLNNEVGVPLTLFGLSSEHVAAVIEMGMNHLGEIARLVRMARPKAGLITCVQAAHLEGLGSLDNVARAKGELFEGLEADALAVVNVDDPWVLAKASLAQGRQVLYGMSEKAHVRLLSAEPEGNLGQRLTLACEGKKSTVQLSFLGAHNAQNATGAFALAWAMGWSIEECVAGLEAARPFDRRLTWKVGLHGVRVLDDCYNANPSSMAAALRTVEGLAPKGRAVAVLGDMLELGNHEEAEHQVLGLLAAASLNLAAFFGPRSRHAFEAARGKGLEAAHFTEIEALLTWLQPKLQAGDVVLVKGSRGMRLERVVQALSVENKSEAH